MLNPLYLLWNLKINKKTFCPANGLPSKAKITSHIDPTPSTVIAVFCGRIVINGLLPLVLLVLKEGFIVEFEIFVVVISDWGIKEEIWYLYF